MSGKVFLGFVFGLVGFGLVWGISEEKTSQEKITEILKQVKINLRMVQVDGFSKEKPALCSSQAPKIFEEISKDGIEVGRSSHKIRNSKNNPRSWMISLLEEFKKTKIDQPAQPQTVQISDGKIGYAEPIYVEDICLKCHGKSLLPKIKLELKEKYPKDFATGFEYGEFRGIFWVELPGKL